MNRPLTWWKDLYATKIWEACGGNLTLNEITEIFDHIADESNKNKKMKENK